MIQVHLVGVRVELPTSQPLVLLKETAGERHLPIWVGPAEASAIAMASHDVAPVRPMTHDLMADILAMVGEKLMQVRITRFHDSVFYAQLVFGDGRTLSARPSDALALAQRLDCELWCAEEVMDEASVLVSFADEDSEEETVVDEELQLRQFRRFLDQVDPDDFQSS